MGSCLSKKKGSSSSLTAPVESELKNSSLSSVSVSKPKVETELELVKLNKENKRVQEKQGESQVKKEIFIIKHRKSHDDRDRNCKLPPPQASTNEEAELTGDKTAATTKMGVVGVRTSSCTKEEVDAILIHCGRLSRSSSGKAVAAASVGGGRKFSGSKRSFDFDHCDNDNISTDEDQKKDNANVIDLGEDERHQHRHRHCASSQERRRRTPSREREQQHRSSSRERRVSRSPGRRSSENNAPANAKNNSNNHGPRPGKMVSVPATVSSLVIDKSSNGGVGVGGESAAATTVIKRITVRRNVGAASPRSQSPARVNGNAANANKVLSENQQQPSLSRNSSRKAEQSPLKRNPLSEIEPNSIAFPFSNNNSSRVQNRPRKEFEAEANQKLTALDKDLSVNFKTKVEQKEDIKVQSSMADNIVVKTVVSPGGATLKPPTLTRSRSSRQSRDLDFIPDALLNPPQSYTSLLLEDIQNFHQKNTPSVILPACVTKACSILEAVADLNNNTRSNFFGVEDRISPSAFQPSRIKYDVPLSTNDPGKREPDTNEPLVESMFVFNDDDVMEPSMQKYMTVNIGDSLGGVDMEDLESSGSNSITVTSGQQHWGISSSSWEPSSVDSKDCWTSRLNNSREQGPKSSLGLEGRVSSEAGRDPDGARKKLNSRRRECDHQHGSGIGRGRLGANKALHTIPVVTTAGFS